MRILPSIIFSLIAYFMTGLQRSAGQFFVFLITIFMASVFGSAICFFISATIPAFGKIYFSYPTSCLIFFFNLSAVALIVVVLIFVIMFVFSGFLISLASVFDWLSWIQWISAFRYASNVLTINEFRHIQFCLANNTNICPTTGADILKNNALNSTTDWDMWKYFFALTMMTIIFFVLAYIQLFRIKKTK
jgi:ATP-binding cassette subfamily G (WHITE) protein 2